MRCKLNSEHVSMAVGRIVSLGLSAGEGFLLPCALNADVSI